jgi:hypothetical protein
MRISSTQLKPILAFPCVVSGSAPALSSLSVLWLLNLIFHLKLLNSEHNASYVDANYPTQRLAATHVTKVRSRVRFPALPIFLRNSRSGTGPTRPHEDK